MALTKVNGDGVGTLSSGLTLTSDDPTITMTDSSGTNDIATVQATSGALILTARDGSADGEIIFKKTDGSATDETMRIDSSGNLLVGKTSTDISVAGSRIGSFGAIFTRSDGSEPLRVNRTSTDGELIRIDKDGSKVGSIGAKTGRPFFSNGENSGIRIAGNALHPADQNGTGSDNSESLGESSVRWTQLFAGTATIGTSDETEKQNIASLTDAEITAAKAISKLFKTFKFKDAVASKGDAARTHTGVIAQQVQTAMTDAGLDAADYSFWCSDTWTNDDGTSQTRLGIRYAELLAFIGAATEQRLANLETRVTALEDA